MKEILSKSLKLSDSSRGVVLLIRPILRLLESYEEQIFRLDFPQTFPLQTFGHSYLLQKMQTKMKTQGSGKIFPKQDDCICTLAHGQ
jgi:hypothetical protein